MKSILFALTCGLTITSMSSCKFVTPGEQRTAAVKDVLVTIPSGVGSVEVSAVVEIESKLITVPCAIPSTQVRLLAAKQQNILNSTTAYVWYEEGNYVNIEQLAFNSTNDLK